MTGPNVAHQQFVIGDHATGEGDNRFGGLVEKGEVSDVGASQHLVKKRQMVVTMGHDGDGRGSRHANRFADFRQQFLFDFRKVQNPSDDPVEKSARSVGA